MTLEHHTNNHCVKGTHNSPIWTHIICLSLTQSYFYFSITSPSSETVRSSLQYFLTHQTVAKAANRSAERDVHIYDASHPDTDKW